MPKKYHSKKMSTTNKVLLFGGIGGLGLYILLKGGKGGTPLIPGIAEGGLLPEVGKTFEQVLGGEGGDPFAGIKKSIASILPQASTAGMPSITGGIKPGTTTQGQPGASSEGGGQSALPWLPEYLTTPSFVQEEVAKAGGILGRQLLSEFTIAKSIIRPIPLRSEVQAAGKISRAAIKSFQTALEVEKPILMTASKAAEFTAEKIAVKATPKVIEEIAIKAAPKVAAEVAEKAGGKIAVMTALKAAPKIGAKVAEKAIPIIGWASLLADVGADISRIFGAKPTEWLGFSPLLEPFLGYNPIEKWAAGGDPGYAENISPVISERSPKVEADMDSSTITYPVSSESVRIGNNVFTQQQLDIFGQQAIQAAYDYENSYQPQSVALNYIETPAVVPVSRPADDLGKYLPGRWGQASLDKASAKQTQEACSTCQ